MPHRLATLLILLAVLAQPCSVSYPRRIWAKQPGSTSKLFAFERNGRVGFIDASGKVLIKPTIKARIDDVGDFSDGLARVPGIGYVDGSGHWAFKHQFRFASDFADGVAIAAIDDPNRKYHSMGLILDKTGGTLATTPTFSTDDFSEGLARFEAEGKRGIRKFEPGNFVYRDFPGLKGFIDREGKVTIPATFADAGSFKSGLAWAALDGYCYLVTAENHRQGSPTSGYPSSCGGAPADAVQVCMVGFIDRSGNFVIQPVLEAAQDFQEDLAAVRIGGRWGFIDKTGTVIVAPRFEQVYSFREGFAAVKLTGKWGFIDKLGTLVIPARFESVESFSDSLAIAYRNDDPVFIDSTGEVVLPGPYLEATPFVHGLAAVRRSENHVEYINHSGETVFAYDRQ